MYRVVIIGGGWSGCAAALTARKAGAEVVLLEKTDLLLGLGNVGGIMRNNGRFTAAEENVALGAGDLFAVTDRCSRHINIDFPGHKHASLYDVSRVEPEVRRLLREKGIDIRFMARAVDVVLQEDMGTASAHGRRQAVEDGRSSGSTVQGIGACRYHGRPERSMSPPSETVIEKIILAGGEEIEGDVFVETSGSTQPCR